MDDPLYGPYGSPLLDTFNRTNGDMGGNWVAWGGMGRPQIVANRLYASGATQEAASWVSAVTASCEVWGKASSSGTGSVALILCSDAPGYNYYGLTLNAGGGITYGKTVGGSSTSFTSLGVTCVTDTYYALVRIGSLVEVWFWTGSSWSKLGSTTDTSINNGGLLVADLNGNSATATAALDSFGGGAIPIVLLTPQATLETGVVPSYTGSLSALGTYTFPNDGHTLLHFLKTGANACTATISAPGLAYWDQTHGQRLADRLVTVPANTGNVIAGPFPAGIYNNSIVRAGQTDSDVTFTLSETTGLSVAALQVGS
jgi:hypothetical protein